MTRIFIIAEAGVNHNGDFETAKKLADAAKYAGADAVKFQTFITENIVTADAKKALYQIENTSGSDSQFDMIKKLELSFREFRELKAYCDSISIQFLSTPFDLESLHFLDEMDLSVWKIPSGEITNVPYLIAIAHTSKPVIMSTGMSTVEEIDFAVNLLKTNGSGKISLLHCNTEYPTPFEDVNLKAMKTLTDKFGCAVGYSDHSLGIEVPIAAAAMGAAIIEKHFTLDKNMEGPDHKASMEPQELKVMVTAIRNVELALGTGKKIPTKTESKNIDVSRKSIVAGRAIKKGEILTEENITVKRPGNGISPIKWFEVIGTKAVRDFQKDEFIVIES